MRSSVPVVRSAGCARRAEDSDAVFSTLIGGAGVYAVTPEGRFVSGGYYEEGSLIWRSRWVTETGIVECREALAFPGQPDGLVVLRRVIAQEAPAQLRVVLHPLAGFGAEPLREPERDSGVWTARVGDLHLRWSGGRKPGSATPPPRAVGSSSTSRSTRGTATTWYSRSGQPR